MPMFSQPSQGDKFNVSEHIGSLCLFFVHDVRQDINTGYGSKEAVACDVHVLDGPGAGEIAQDTLLFQGALIGSLRSAAGGDPVLGRIGQGLAKPGQNAPYILSEYTAQDAALAEKYLTERAKRFSGTGPTTTAPGATQGPAATASAATPAPANGIPPTGTVDIASLPPEVQALLKSVAG